MGSGRLPCRQSQDSASFRTTSMTESISSAPCAPHQPAQRRACQTGRSGISSGPACAVSRMKRDLYCHRFPVFQGLAGSFIVGAIQRKA